MNVASSSRCLRTAIRAPRSVFPPAPLAPAHARYLTTLDPAIRHRHGVQTRMRPFPSGQSRRTFFSLADISKLAGLLPGQEPPSSSPSSSSTSSSRASATTTTSPSATSIQMQVISDGEEQRFYARKILPFSQKQLYALVADVGSYSAFIPFCQSSTVLRSPPPSSTSSSPSESISDSASDSASTNTREWKEWKAGDRPFTVLAELAVGFGGLEERYVSKVVGRPFESVTATASNQTPLFKSLISTWSFSPASSFSPHPSSGSTSSTSSEMGPSPREPNSTSPAASDPTLGPTLLTIDLAFTFANPLHRIASQAVLPKVAEKMVEAFERRCLEVWGEGKS